jgi:RNA polymerase sigma-70 factor, ECF subfamily
MPTDRSSNSRFQAIVVPELRSAYSLARWITGNSADADDIVQEAMLRAYQYFESYRGDNGRAWLLQIVRNVASTWASGKSRLKVVSLDQDMPQNFELQASPAADGSAATDPAEIAERASDLQRLRRAIADLPREQREVVVLRDIEGLAYRDIAAILELPLGTMMSRLSRARDELEQRLRPLGGQPQ